MRNVFAFFYRIRAEIVLVGLLLLCINLLYHNSPFQKAVFAKKTSSINGKIYGLKHGMTSYFNLREENERLNFSIQQLQEKSKNSFEIIPSTQFEVNDTLYRQTYFYQTATVINSTVNRPRNTLTINRGTNHGVAVGNGVISNSGAVGVVTKVSDNYALAIPIINNQFTASVEILHKRFFGLMRWDGGHPRKAAIYDITDYADIVPGDTVITRGASATYPRGIMVGVVSEVEREPALGKLRVSVDLSVDFASLRNVLIINHAYREELNNLEN